MKAFFFFLMLIIGAIMVASVNASCNHQGGTVSIENFVNRTLNWKDFIIKRKFCTSYSVWSKTIAAVTWFVTPATNCVTDHLRRHLRLKYYNFHQDWKQRYFFLYIFRLFCINNISIDVYILKIKIS